MSIARPLLLESLTHYFTKHEAEYKKMIAIINREEGAISLRSLEKLCSPEQKNLFIEHKGQFICIQSLYANALDTYGKKNFDTFRRKGKQGERAVKLKLHGIPLNTTIGQLNFFRLAFRSGLIEFAEKSIN